jgi:hypothetical protein
MVRPSAGILAAPLARELCRSAAVTIRHEFVGFDAAAANLIDRILADAAIPEDFDLLSIDIDGNDYYVWQAMMHYPTASNDVVFVQDPNNALNQGSSLLALIQLGKEKGYELACVTACNGIFVRADSFPALGILDNDIDAMRCDAGPRILFGYDGTVFTASLDYLPWTSVKLDPEDLQVLPRGLRRYRYEPDGT